MAQKSYKIVELPKWESVYPDQKNETDQFLQYFDQDVWGCSYSDQGLPRLSLVPLPLPDLFFYI